MTPESPKIDRNQTGQQASPDPPVENSAPTKPDRSKPARSKRGFRISRLASKELRETLRDRRTIVTLILMPLLVYPLLSVFFSTFLLNNASRFKQPVDRPIQYKIGYRGDVSEEVMAATLSEILAAVVRRKTFEKRKSLLAQKRESVARGEDPSGIDAEIAELEESRRRPLEKNQEPRILSNEELMAKYAPGEVVGFQDHIWSPINEATDGTLEELIESGQLDIGLDLRCKDRGRFQFASGKMLVSDSFRSKEAYQYLKTEFESVNTLMFRQLARAARQPVDFALDFQPQDLVSKQVVSKANTGVSIATLMPLILVLMTITGAVYPAIDLTAGERERGTLETLMAAPVPRMSILLSKFIAVLVVAVMTATLNIVGMMVTLWNYPKLYDMVFSDGSLSLLIMFKIFLLLVLFAAFFSALLLAVTSFARSFKEAQAYLIPIILLSMAPGLMAMMPGLTLAGPLAVVPMVNILLLARDVLHNDVMMVPALVTVVSTMVYTFFGVFVAARIFGADAILYGSQGSWSDLLARPRKRTAIVPEMPVVFCMVLLFPINFIFIGMLSRFESFGLRIFAMGVFTFITFMVFPWCVAKYQRVQTATGFGTLPTRFVYLLAAVILGLSLWPFAMAMISGLHQIYALLGDSGKSDALAETAKKLAEKVRELPVPMIAISFALIPAIAEEWFFRGMLMRTLLRYRGKWFAILVSAGLFGVFHLLSQGVAAPDRFIPTALIGIILGYLCYKSGSIVPGIILHTIHNALLIFMAYFQPQLSQFDWFPKENDPIPLVWVLVSLLPAAMGLFMISRSRRHGNLGLDSDH